MLFIVPWLHAGTSTGSACMMTSTIRWLVSVFPATTGAGNSAFTSEARGAFTPTGDQHPLFVGASGARHLTM
jgi:hypothetical protein